MDEERQDRIVVDTDVLIDYFAGISPSAEVVEQLLQRDRLAIVTLTLFELACGAQTEEQLQDIELLIQAAHRIDLEAAAALRAGAVYRQLRSQGQLIPVADLLIAGCCLNAGLPLLTRNVEHFRRVPGLTVLGPSQVLPNRGR